MHISIIPTYIFDIVVFVSCAVNATFASRPNRAKHRSIENTYLVLQLKVYTITAQLIGFFSWSDLSSVGLFTATYSLYISIKQKIVLHFICIMVYPGVSNVFFTLSVMFTNIRQPTCQWIVVHYSLSLWSVFVLIAVLLMAR